MKPHLPYLGARVGHPERVFGLAGQNPPHCQHAWPHLVPYRFPENSACSMKSPAAMSRCITSLVTK